MYAIIDKAEKQKNTYHTGQGSQSTNISALPCQDYKKH